MASHQLALIALFVVAVAGSAPATTGDPAAGRRTATESCTSCHVVGEDTNEQAVEGVPTFRALARDPAMTESRLRGFLHRPHPPMPNISLTRREIDNLVSYIESLRGTDRR